MESSELITNLPQHRELIYGISLQIKNNFQHFIYENKICPPHTQILI